MAGLHSYRVLVTGGAGCLGQSLVRLLRNVVNVREIRTVDLKPLPTVLFKVAYLDFDARGESHICRPSDLLPAFDDGGWWWTDENETRESAPPIVEYQADVGDEAVLMEALDEVDVVFHTAAYVDATMFPDINKLRTVNVEGTRQVIAACLHKNVRRLIYTSTVDVVVGADDVIDGHETSPHARPPLIEQYSRTKQEAERLILDIDGHHTINGSRLRTIALRPTAFYGEHDATFVVPFIAAAERTRGVLPRVGKGGHVQQTYVGNVAWAHICAWEGSVLDERICGLAYNVTDDTPIINCFQLIKPFLVSRGLVVPNIWLPVWCASGGLTLLRGFINLLHLKWNPNICPSSIRYINRNISFSSDLAKTTFRYKPRYDYKDSLARSLPYYRSLIFIDKF